MVASLAISCLSLASFSSNFQRHVGLAWGRLPSAHKPNLRRSAAGVGLRHLSGGGRRSTRGWLGRCLGLREQPAGKEDKPGGEEPKTELIHYAARAGAMPCVSSTTWVRFLALSFLITCRM
jgi:hypothetical protein